MATIFCFSTTGNSLYIANTIAKSLESSVVSMSTPPACCDDDIIGFVFPVYFWGLPNTVASYIEKLKITNKNAYVFTIVCYGGKVSGVQGIVKQLLQQKGVALQYGKNIKSVENYLPRYNVNNTPELHQDVDDNINIICSDIKAKKKTKLERYTFLNKIVYSLYPGKDGSKDVHFSITENCTQCGICGNICPSKNIQLQQGKPIFLHQCEHCMACVHACPTHSINWKDTTQTKEQYRNPHIGAKELIAFCGGTQNNTL